MRRPVWSMTNLRPDTTSGEFAAEGPGWAKLIPTRQSDIV